MYTVEVKVGGEYTTHSTHASYIDAVDQADMVHGRVAEVNEDSDAFNTGYAAGDNGDAKKSNPYAKGTWDSLNWIAGWEKAQ